MRRFLSLCVALASLATACGGSASSSVAEEVSGPEAWRHGFVANTLDGGTIDAGDYEGQDLVLWFWAPW